MIRCLNCIWHAAAAWMLLNAAAPAAEFEFTTPEPELPPYEEDYAELEGYGDCAECCEPGGGFVGTLEATFFRYHRADGVNFGSDAGEDVEFGFEISPRITLGYAGSDGFGTRLRWWRYEERGEPIDDNDGFICVDTYTLDWELFDTIHIDCNWSVEISGGLRVNEFEEVLRESDEEDTRENDFNGFGGLFGLEVKRCLAEGLFVFARLRGSILMDDKRVYNRDGGMLFQDRLLLDSTQGMLELALGCEYADQLESGATLFLRFQGEWQNWFNYSSAFNPEYMFTGPSDVGFGGIAVSFGLTR